MDSMNVKFNFLGSSNPADHFTRYAAKSYDIHASPTLSRRPPLKSKANMFEIVEERK